MRQLPIFAAALAIAISACTFERAPAQESARGAADRTRSDAGTSAAPTAVQADESARAEAWKAWTEALHKPPCAGCHVEDAPGSVWKEWRWRKKTNLPDVPTRDETVAALTAKCIVDKVAKCKGSGLAIAAFQVASSGKVIDVTVTGVDEKAGACVGKAVRTARFPRFENEEGVFNVKYPYRLGS